MDEFRKIVADIISTRLTPSTSWQLPIVELHCAFGALCNSLSSPPNDECLRLLLELGEMLRKAYWDFRLPYLVGHDPDDAYDYEYAVILLQEASKLNADTVKLTSALSLISTTPELAKLRERIYEIERQLAAEKLEELPPWSPPMKRADFELVIKPLKSERAFRTAMDEGNWESDPPWKEKRRAERRYRSKDADEQRRILKMIREFQLRPDS